MYRSFASLALIDEDPISIQIDIGDLNSHQLTHSDGPCRREVSA